MLLPIKGTAVTFANEFIGMFEDWDDWEDFILEVEGEEKTTADLLLSVRRYTVPLHLLMIYIYFSETTGTFQEQWE